MKTSWYKEPWAWFVFFLPFSAVVAGITTYIIANHEPDSLVIGDYYKKGKAINMEVSKVKLAQKLGMRFALKFSNNELVIRPTGIEKIFPVLNVNFYHVICIINFSRIRFPFCIRCRRFFIRQYWSSFR